MTLWDNAKAAPATTMQSVFAEEVVYTQPGHASVVLWAIFTERFMGVELGGQMPVQTADPVFEIKLADLTFKPRPNDQIMRETGDTYEVIKSEIDGEGSVKLFTVLRR